MAAAKAPSPKAPREEERPKVWAFNVGGQLVRLNTLSLDVMHPIADEYDTTPYVLVFAPMAKAGVADKLYRACCDVAKVAAPAKLSFKLVFDALEQVDDIDEDPTGADPTTT